MRESSDRAATSLGSTLDPAQRPAADRLAALGARAATARHRTPWLHRAPEGVYLHGPVGRGKTWLVDVLLEQVDGAGVLRLHAYDAARSLHGEFAR